MAQFRSRHTRTVLIDYGIPYPAEIEPGGLTPDVPDRFAESYRCQPRLWEEATAAPASAAPAVSPAPPAAQATAVTPAPSSPTTVQVSAAGGASS